MKRRPADRETIISHLPFRSCFLLKKGNTIFRIIEKKYNEHQVVAHVLQHADLLKTFDFNEVVFHLTTEDVSVINLLLKSYNSH